MVSERNRSKKQQKNTQKVKDFSTLPPKTATSRIRGDYGGHQDSTSLVVTVLSDRKSLKKEPEWL